MEELTSLHYNFIYFYEYGLITTDSDPYWFSRHENKDISKFEIYQLEEKQNRCTFKTFDKVLVRNYSNCEWQPALYGKYNEQNSNLPHCTLSGLSFEQCILFEGNEDLAYTSNSPK